MKFLLLLILTANAWGLTSERSPCWTNRSSCIDFQGLSTVFGRAASVLNTIGVTNQRYPGIYYQRGTGSSCPEAKQRARERMVFNHPEFICDGDFDGERDDIYCGSQNQGPEVLGGDCMRSRSGEIVAWLKCDNRSAGRRLKGPSGDPGIGLVLLKSLQRSESRARASK